MAQAIATPTDDTDEVAISVKLSGQEIGWWSDMTLKKRAPAQQVVWGWLARKEFLGLSHHARMVLLFMAFEEDKQKWTNRVGVQGTPVARILQDCSEITDEMLVDISNELHEHGLIQLGAAKRNWLLVHEA